MWNASEPNVRKQGPTATNLEALRAVRRAVACPAVADLEALAVRILVDMGHTVVESMVMAVDMEETRLVSRIRAAEEINSRNMMRATMARFRLLHDGKQISQNESQRKPKRRNQKNQRSTF